MAEGREKFGLWTTGVPWENGVRRKCLVRKGCRPRDGKGNGIFGMKNCVSCNGIVLKISEMVNDDPLNKEES